MNLTQIENEADLQAWKRVPELMLEYYEKSRPVAEQLKEAGVTETVYYCPETNVTHFANSLKAMDQTLPWVKVAGSNTLKSIAKGLNYFPNELSKHVPGLQSPMGAMLTSGLVGAGLGYGGGMLAEQMLPEEWERKKLRRTMAILGGLGLAAPAAAWAGVNAANDKSVLDGWPLDTGHVENRAPDPPRHYDPIFSPENSPVAKFTRKLAAAFESETGVSSEPLINVNAFNQTIWGDPRVTHRMSPVLQAAGSGLVTGAATLAGSGRPATFITPWDVGRMAAGMGSGYASGELVGRALGILTGMPQSTQDRLKQTGMWAGVVNTMLPLAFGGR